MQHSPIIVLGTIEVIACAIQCDGLI